MAKRTAAPYYERKVVSLRGGSPHAWLVRIPAADHARDPVGTAKIADAVETTASFGTPKDLDLVLDSLRKHARKYLSRTPA